MLSRMVRDEQQFERGVARRRNLEVGHSTNSRMKTSPHRKSGMDSAARSATSVPASTTSRRAHALGTASGETISSAVGSATMNSSVASAAKHQASTALPRRDRRAEIAMCDAGEPDEELFDDALVETIERAQPIDIDTMRGRRLSPNRVAWWRCGSPRRRRRAEQRDGHRQPGGGGNVAGSFKWRSCSSLLVQDGAAPRPCSSPGRGEDLLVLVAVLLPLLREKCPAGR